MMNLGHTLKVAFFSILVAIVMIVFVGLANLSMENMHIQGLDSARAYLGKYGYFAIAGSTTTISDNLIPSANNTYDVGANSARWNDVYTQNMTASGNISANKISTNFLTLGGANVTRSVTYTVASSTAPAHVKAQSDFVVVGTATDELQAAISALPLGGGIVQLSGNFTSGKLTPVDGLVLQGQGQNTILKLANGTNDYLIDGTAGFDDVEIRDMCLDGNGINQTAGDYVVYLRGDRCKLLHVLVKNAYSHAIYGLLPNNWVVDDLVLLDSLGNAGGAADFYIANGNDNFLDRIYVDGNPSRGIEIWGLRNKLSNSTVTGTSASVCFYIERLSEGTSLNSCTALNAVLSGFAVESSDVLASEIYASGCNIGFEIEGTIANPVIGGMLLGAILEGNTSAAFAVTGGTSNYTVAHIQARDTTAGPGMSITQTSLIGNDRIHVYGSQSYNNQTFGAVVDVGSTNVVLSDNDLLGNLSGAVSGTPSVAHHNLGYVTESSGTSLGTGAQQTVAHGLNFTPTISQIGVFSDNVTPVTVAQTASPDVTNIYVTCNETGSAWHWATIGR